MARGSSIQARLNSDLSMRQRLENDVLQQFEVEGLGVKRA